MQYECKITILETKVFPELQKEYLADPQSGPCPCFKKRGYLCPETNTGTGRFLSFDEWKILWRSMGCHQSICIYGFAGRLNYAKMDQR